MNKELWEFNKIGTVSIDNDANDYYYEWLDADIDGMSLKDLCEKYLGVGIGKKEVRVKARNGAIFIVVKGDKDDTQNPE